MSSISVNTITDASGGSTTSINGFTPSVSNMAGRNRIINGDMRIDQRNAGASVTPTNAQYLVDRWLAGVTGASSTYSVQQNAGSVTPPIGFTNYLGITSLSSYSVTSSDAYYILQKIEGFNIADLAWGTANAKTVTLSFQVYSSLTGTFGGSITNSAFSRSYPFIYSISSANTWTTISVTIVGDTAGTWLTNNGSGIQVFFGLGSGSTYSGTTGSWSANGYVTATGATSVVGTSGATFYITGVQLEEGSVATPFCSAGGGSYGAELALCQRYFEKFVGDGGSNIFLYPIDLTSGYRRTLMPFKITKRATPTITFSGSGNIPSGTQFLSVDGVGFQSNGIASSTYINIESYTASAEL